MTKKNLKKCLPIFKTTFFFIHFFSILKSSETYAQKILWSALFEGGGSADRYLGQGPLLCPHHAVKCVITCKRDTFTTSHIVCDVVTFVVY